MDVISTNIRTDGITAVMTVAHYAEIAQVHLSHRVKIVGQINISYPIRRVDIV
jgi:hypothetical protein